MALVMLKFLIPVRIRINFYHLHIGQVETFWIRFFIRSSPDFENNASTNGDGNYSITVRVSDDNPTPAYTDIHLDFIIQNVDDSISGKS